MYILIETQTSNPAILIITSFKVLTLHFLSTYLIYVTVVCQSKYGPCSVEKGEQKGSSVTVKSNFTELLHCIHSTP